MLSACMMYCMLAITLVSAGVIFLKHRYGSKEQKLSDVNSQDHLCVAAIACLCDSLSVFETVRVIHQIKQTEEIT